MDMFHKKAFGLDIADHTIEVVELRKSFLTQKITVTAKQRVPLEHGVVDHGRLINRKKLSESLNGLWDMLGIVPQSVVFGLPEHQTYTVVLHFSDGNPSDKTIADRVAQTIPLERDDISLSSVRISRSRDGVDLLVYAVSRETMNEWGDFFESIGIDIHAFDHELLAIGRGLFGALPPDTSCVVDIGAERTKIALFSKRGLEYVHALDRAGDVFTMEMSRALELSVDAAEKMKREVGMDPVNVYPLYQKLLEPIITEIHTAALYAHDTLKSPASLIVLVGGSAQLKGIVEYIAEQTKISVKLGSSFLIPGASGADTEQLHYIEAIGLALKDIEPIWEKRHPSLR